MTEISDLLNSVTGLDGGSILPPSGLPAPIPGAALPDDLVEFYSRCGGLALVDPPELSLEFLAPAAVLPANPAIIGESDTGDISDFWFLLVRVDGTEYLTIDLHPDRLGRCYDSFHEIHAVAGSTPVIARSFTELLRRCVESYGQGYFWLREGFRPSADAYD